MTLEIILRNVYLPSEYNQDGIHGIYVQERQNIYNLVLSVKVGDHITTYIIQLKHLGSIVQNDIKVE